MNNHYNEFETVIGLEVHIELSTKTKIFCGCSTKFGSEVNSQICPVCMGMPGTLPTLNKKVVEYAVKVAVATNCNITKKCLFDRKNYFYPDNPQNYQISQLYLPICTNGFLEINNENICKKIGIHEIHMEEDAGKLIHDEALGKSYVDYNRAGVPLIEIVTEADFRSADEVILFLEKLRLIIQYLEVSDCKLNEGSMRVDINLSVRKTGESEYGTRTEMKNLNSFRAIKRAIESETKRQVDIILNKEEVILETRRWDDSKGESYSMRSKEDARDYRYFPEPDLMPINISGDYIEYIKTNLPEFRDEKIERYVKEYDIPKYDAEIITSEKALANLFEETVLFGANPKKVSNYIMGETLKLMKEREIEAEQISFSPNNLAFLIDLDDRKVINSTVAKEIFVKVFDEDINPVQYVNEHGLAQNNDADELTEIIEKVLDNNAQSVSDYLNGKDRAIGYLVGQTMKETKGKANPELVKEILKKSLENRRGVGV